MCAFSCNYGLLLGVESNKKALGHYAAALSGHDSGKIYLVVGFREDKQGAAMLLLADGKSRPVDKPKAKKLKHVAVLKAMDEGIASKLEAGERVDDSEIIHSLKKVRNDRHCDF